jgi:hypothetical protein
LEGQRGSAEEGRVSGATHCEALDPPDVGGRVGLVACAQQAAGACCLSAALAGCMPLTPGATPAARVLTRRVAPAERDAAGVLGRDMQDAQACSGTSLDGMDLLCTGSSAAGTGSLPVVEALDPPGRGHSLRDMARPCPRAGAIPCHPAPHRAPLGPPRRRCRLLHLARYGPRPAPGRGCLLPRAAALAGVDVSLCPGRDWLRELRRKL